MGLKTIYFIILILGLLTFSLHQESDLKTNRKLNKCAHCKKTVKYSSGSVSPQRLLTC